MSLQNQPISLYRNAFFYPTASIVSDITILKSFKLLETAITDYINHNTSNVYTVKIPIPDIQTIQVNYNEEIPEATILGRRIFCPPVISKVGSTPTIKNTGFAALVSQELYECKEGYKKILEGSPMDFDGGYQIAKLYLDSESDDIIKIVFLTPTQAEFDKDECPVEIHPWPWFNGKCAISESMWKKIGSRYGFYTEADELRSLPKKSIPDSYSYFHNIKDCKTLGDGYPIMKKIRIQQVPNENRYAFYLDGYETTDPSDLIMLYEDLQDRANLGDKPPYCCHAYLDKDNRILEINSIGSNRDGDR